MGKIGLTKRDIKIIAVVCAGVALIYIVVLMLLIILLVANPPWRQQPRQESFSEFRDQVDRGAVSSVKIYDRDLTIEGMLKNKAKFKTAFPANYDITKLVEGKVEQIEVDPQNTGTLSVIIPILLLLFLRLFVPFLIVLAVLLFVHLQRRNSE